VREAAVRPRPRIDRRLEALARAARHEPRSPVGAAGTRFTFTVGDEPDSACAIRHPDARVCHAEQRKDSRAARIRLEQRARREAPRPAGEARELLGDRRMSTVLVLLTKLELALRLTQAMPTIEINNAYAHASAAVDAATPELPADLLLAIAYIESRYDPTSTSRIENEVRRTGRYPSRRRGPEIKGPLFCGPLQTHARTWKQCLAMRDLTTGYSAAVREISSWMRDRRVRGNITRALNGHGCGNHGVNTGKCNNYPRRIFKFRRKLDRPTTLVVERSLM
jgi:hypothetical protein